MPTAEEIIVALKSKGAKRTKSDLQEVDEEVNEVTESTEESSSRLEDISSRLSGVFKALLAGVAVVTGGLLTKIPVLKEVAAGLGSVFTSIGLQIDKQLRPALSNLTKGLFELSGAIAEGNFDEVKAIFKDAANAVRGINFSEIANNVLSSFGGIFTGLGKLAKNTNVKKQFKKFLQGIGDFLGKLNYKKFFGDIVTGITTFITNVDWLGIGADLIKFIANGIASAVRNTDWSQLVGDITSSIIKTINNTDWVQVGKNIITFISNGIAAIGGFLIEQGMELGAWIKSQFDSAINDAKQWGKDLIQEFIDGIQAKISELENKLDSVEQKIRDRFPGSPAETGPLKDLDKTGPALIEEFSSGVEGSAGNAGSTVDTALDASAAGGFKAQRRKATRIFIDGRDITDETARFRYDRTGRRDTF